VAVVVERTPKDLAVPAVLAVAVVVVHHLVELETKVVMAVVPLTLDQLDGLLAVAVVQEVIPVTPPVVLELLLVFQRLSLSVVVAQVAVEHPDLLTVQVTRDLMDIAMDPLFLVLQRLPVPLTPLVVAVEQVPAPLDLVLAVVDTRNQPQEIPHLVATVLSISKFPKTS
jgi:hypothetical protein